MASRQKDGLTTKHMGRYPRSIDLHVIPRIGRIPLRHLLPDHLERLYADLLDAGRADGKGGLHNKTVVEIHMILRRALDAVRRGWILANPAKVAHQNVGHCRATPRKCGTPTNSAHSWPRHATIATTPPSGSPPTSACDAARFSACAGATSTSTLRTSL